MGDDPRHRGEAEQPAVVIALELLDVRDDGVGGVKVPEVRGLAPDLGCLGVLVSGQYAAGAVEELVVACVEGEQHALPARIVATELRSASWRASFLGRGTPATELRTFASAQQPDDFTLLGVEMLA